jgi:hypothetical protein
LYDLAVFPQLANLKANMPTLFFLVAILSCKPGDRSIDLSTKMPHNLKTMDFVVSVDPFYARLYIYGPDSPENFQQCCSNKSTSVIRLPTGDGRFCVRQSQPQMKWTIRALFKPDIEM